MTAVNDDTYVQLKKLKKDQLLALVDDVLRHVDDMYGDDDGLDEVLENSGIQLTQRVEVVVRFVVDANHELVRQPYDAVESWLRDAVDQHHRYVSRACVLADDATVNELEVEVSRIEQVAR